MLGSSFVLKSSNAQVCDSSCALSWSRVIIIVLVPSARGRGSMHGILRRGVSMSDRSN